MSNWDDFKATVIKGSVTKEETMDSFCVLENTHCTEFTLSNGDRIMYLPTPDLRVGDMVKVKASDKFYDKIDGQIGIITKVRNNQHGESKSYNLVLQTGEIVEVGRSELIKTGHYYNMAHLLDEMKGIGRIL